MEIVHLIARLNDGGPARVLHSLCQQAAAVGWRSRIICGQVEQVEGDLAQRLAAEGIAIEQLPGFGQRMDLRGDLQALRALVKRLRRAPPQVLHTHTAKAGVLGRLAAAACRVPCLHSFHGHVLSGYFGPGLSQAMALVERSIGGLGPAWHHAPTPYLVRELQQRFAIGRAARWAAIPVPVAPVLPVDAPWHAEFQTLRAGRPVLALVGRWAAVKDVPLYLDVLERLQPHGVVGLLAGDGPLHAQLMPQIERLRQRGISVYTPGFVPMAQALRVSDVLLLCSRNEGQPLAIVEALGAGVPVVACNVGGVRDLAAGFGQWPAWQAGQGAFVALPRGQQQAENAAALAAAVLHVVRHPDAAQRARGQLLARQLAPAALWPRYQALYDRVAHA